MIDDIERRELAIAAGWEPPPGSAMSKLIETYRGFVEQMGDCLRDGDVVMANHRGNLTFGDVRAAIHGWGSRPTPPAGLTWRTEPPDRPGFWLRASVEYLRDVTETLWFGPIPEPERGQS